MIPTDPPQWRENYATAVAASEGMKAALAALGIPERGYRGIRPAMTSAGRPYVYLGILHARTVDAVIAALQPALADGVFAAGPEVERQSVARPPSLTERP
ncbi:hypothetical protein ACWC1D_32085 [Streptomyces sp. NPDC001478]